MKGKAKDLISPYFIEDWKVNPEDEFEITYVDAKQFLTPDRFDLICKLIYIDCKVKNQNLEFAKELYTEHIRAFSWGTFTEPGNDNKNSIEKYFETFDYLIESCQKEKLSAEKSVVGVGPDGNILDGSHRTSVAIYFNIPLPIIKIPNRTVKYDYNMFKERGFKEEYLDYVAYKYLQWKNNVYVAVLWPVADDLKKLQITEKYISKKLDIFYKKEIQLNYNGIIQFMIHTYGNQEWAGSFENKFIGIESKAAPCFKENGKLTLYVLSGADLDDIVELKSKIRELYQIQNHSIHITDTKEETIELGKVALNNNSIDLLNYGSPLTYKEFINKLVVFRRALYDSNYNPEDFIVDSGAVLSLYGLRDTNDIDYMTLLDENLPKSHVYDNHIEYNNHTYYDDSLETLIYNPNKHMYYFGIKFVSFDCTLIMKSRRDEVKDRNDLKLMKRIQLHRIKKYTLDERISFVKKSIKNKGKKNKLLSFMLRCYSFIKKRKNKLIRVMKKCK